ncbi:hypothetical protein Dimus_039652 [Dionaea muscipula]
MRPSLSGRKRERYAGTATSYETRRPDDDLTDVEEEIDCSVEAKRRGISFQRFLRELYENGNPSVGPLGEPGFGNYDFLVVYSKPKVKKRVPRSQVVPVPPPPPEPKITPTGWGEEFEPDEPWSPRPMTQSFGDVKAVEVKTKRSEIGVNAMKQVVFHRPSETMKKHLRPLYVKAEIEGVPVNRVLIDNGAAINTIPYRMLKKFGKKEDDLMPSSVVLTGFSGEVAQSKGMISLDITIGSVTRTTLLFVMSTSTSYNVLLGRDWIHGVGCIPSSLHQCIVQWDEKGNPEIIQADSRPFATETNAVEHGMYTQALGPIRFVQKDDETVVTSQVDDVTPELLNALFDAGRPSLVALTDTDLGRQSGASQDGAQ